MFSLFNKSEERTAVVFDIGNGSIGVALVTFSPNTLPTVIYTYREPLTFLPHITPKRLLEVMQKLLKSVSLHLSKHGFTYLKHHYFTTYIIEDVYCVFSSPWYISETKSLTIEEQRPFVITQAFIDNVIKKEQQQFTQSEAQTEYRKIFGEDIQVLEKNIIHNKLNGYEIQNPLGKKVREYEVTFFSSYMSTSILQHVEESIYSAFHFKHIHFNTYALASWSATQDMFPDNHNFLFFDISGEATDISLTIKGVLLDTVSFSSGRAAVIRKIVDELTVPPDVALSFLNLYLTNNIEPAFSEKIESILKDSREVWLDKLYSVLRGLQQRYTLPVSVFLTADVDISSFFITALQQSLPPEFNVIKNTFVPKYLDAEAVKEFSHFSTVLAPDPFLSLESIFLNKIIY